MKRSVLFVFLLCAILTGAQRRDQRRDAPGAPSHPAVPAVPAFVNPSRPSRPARVPDTNRFLATYVGLWVQIERRGYPALYSNGELLRGWNTYDPLVASTYAQETALQFSKMRAMGVNTVVFELRTSDIDYAGHEAFPDCKINYVLGPQWPTPAADDLAALRSYFDLAQTMGLKVWLILNNTHMEEAPALHSQGWIGAILTAVKNHPALDLVMFGGGTHVVDLDGDGVPDHCGGQSEAPLWLGITSTEAQYVAWAIAYGHSLGIDHRLLSAEAIIGDIIMEGQQPANAGAEDGHLWSPMAVMKSVFDQLQIPSNRRTYAVSFYQHTKCFDAPSWWTCSPDVDVFPWADQSLQSAVQKVAADRGARIVAAEFGRGNSVPIPTERSFEYAIELFRKYGLFGGVFWRWASFNDSEDFDPSLDDPVKRRGVSFTYNPVKKEITDWGGYHLASIPNGSFELDANADGLPDQWTLSGVATRYRLAAETGQPEVPTRGEYCLRLTAEPGGQATATSALLRAGGNTMFTTTVNLRFSFNGDPNPAGAPTTRPQVYLSIHYFTSAGSPSSVRSSDTFRYFQENSTTGFNTFPLQYTTPSDADTLQIEVGVKSNGLSSDIVAYADNIR
jgi:hypothetical protein